MDRELRIQLTEEGADAERLAVLTGYLRRELLKLDVFARPESIEFLRRRMPKASQVAAHQLADGVGDLPLLLEHAAESRTAVATYLAGLDSLAQGIADATRDSGVRVLVVRPGFVTTKMTAGLDPAPMSTTAEAVADATVDALGTDAHTVWVPGRLRLVFALLRHLPRAIFRRLPL